MSADIALANQKVKSKTDKRHLRRKLLVEEFFGGTFRKLDNPSPEAKKILRHEKLIDSLMLGASAEGKTKRINKVDRAVLTVAIWEMAVEKKTPPKVIIDEAVEFAKEFGSESSPGFVNGILGAIFKNQETENKKQ